MPRLRKKYETEIMLRLQDRFAIPNLMAVPRVHKVVVNRGVGTATKDDKSLDAAVKELTSITGQRPIICRARKSIANFRLRQGVPIGCKVTLRGDRMYEFLDRLISVVLPRVRDFRGFPTSSFDGRGNYSLGLADQFVFPEINIDNVQFIQGMDICINVHNTNDEKSLALLTEFGFPFRKS